MYLSRRRFMLGTAGAFIGATHTGTAWPAQALLPPNQSAGPRWQHNAALLRHLPRLLELASVPGLGLGVVEDGHTWTRGFGKASEAPAQPARRETVFEAASLGKPLFAYAVLKLVDARVLELDRPLHEYLTGGGTGPEADTPRMR